MKLRKLVAGPIGRLLCLVLALALTTGPTAQVLAQVAARTSGDVEPTPLGRGQGDTTIVAAPEAGKINLTYVTPQAVALVSLRPHQLLTSPNTALLPVEVASAAGVQQLGIDPADVSEIVAFIEPPLGVSVPYGVIVKFTKPFALSDLREQFRAHTQQADFAGKEYLRSSDVWRPSFFMPDDRTLLVMSEPTLQRVLAPQGVPGLSPLLDRVGQWPGGDDLDAVIDIESLRPLIVPWLNVAAMQQGDKFPAEAKPFLEIPNLVSAIDLSFNITNASPTALVLHANDAQSANRLEELYRLANRSSGSRRSKVPRSSLRAKTRSSGRLANTLSGWRTRRRIHISTSGTATT